MTEQTKNTEHGTEPAAATLRLRLPGFVKDEEIGLGDAIARLTYAVGIKPCAACDRRAGLLNKRVVFTR